MYAVYEYVRDSIGMGPAAEEDPQSTEIRAEEKSRGGMSYEVLLSPSKEVARPPSPTNPTSPRQITHEDIQQKLEQATLRRKSLEATRLAGVTERLQRLSEAQKKRQEQDNLFVSTTAAAIDQKLDTSAANRQAHLADLKAKLAEHLAAVEAVRSSADAQTQKLREEILEKQCTAEENRNELLQAVIAKLKEHEARVVRVRSEQDGALKELEARIQASLEQADEKRRAVLSQRLETLRQHLEKIEVVQESAAKRLEEKCEKTKEEIARVDQVEKPVRSGPCVGEKVERAKVTKEQQLLAKIQATEEKIAQKEAIVQKQRAENALKSQKIKEEQERRAQQVRENKKSLADENSS